MRKRASGILLHITSLPSKYGIGDLGVEAYRFVDFLAQTKQNFWQVLPLNPPRAGTAYSPYDIFSAFAGNTWLISPDLLVQQGFLRKGDIVDIPSFNDVKVDYASVISHKTKWLKIAFERFKSKPKRRDYLTFCSKNKGWLDDFATFNALHKHFNGCAWFRWPPELKYRHKGSLKAVQAELADAIDKEKFFQYIFFKQWYCLKRYCAQHRVKIIGDIPFYVAYDSADVWSNPRIFKLTKTKKPRVVAGVPPDYFSKTGQLWGNPIYDWKTLKKRGYSWWIERIKHNIALFEIVRLDHFRGFVGHWEVPSSHKTAKRGRWVKGPGEDFLSRLFKRFPFEYFIAEDLGHITSDVKAVVEKLDLTSMKVLQFAFDGDPLTNPHCLHNYERNCVVYTGTHDNNTVKGWFTKEISAAQKKSLFDYIGHRVSANRIHWEMIRMAMSSVADIVIIPAQDLLGLDETARMNRPATTKGNWIWRLRPGQITSTIGAKLARLTQTYGRVF